MMGRVRYLSGLVWLLTLPACGAKKLGSLEEQSPINDVSGTVNVVTWWGSASETDAFNTLVSTFKESYPGVDVRPEIRADATDARDFIKRQIHEGNPPDTFPCLLARGCVWTFVNYDGPNATNSKLLNLDELARESGWLDLFPSRLIELVSVKGSMYSVPVNVHRINTVIYNKTIFEQNALSVPTTLAELHGVCDALKANGITPISASAKDGWPLSLMFIDSVFPAIAGGDIDYTRDFLRGLKSADDPLFSAMLDEAIALMAYMNEDRATIDWREATERVRTGKAAMTFMGDWAKADVALRAELGKDFDVFTAPGATDVFVFNSDTFPMTTDSQNREPATAWLKVVASEAGQNAFNLKKGSIPARRLSPESLALYDDYGKRAIDEFFRADTKVAGALSTLLPQEFELAMNAAFAEFSEDRDKQKLLQFFRDNYASLSNP